MAIEIPGGKRNLNMNINAQQVIQMHTYQTIQVYIKFNLLTFVATSQHYQSYI